MTSGGPADTGVASADTGEPQMVQGLLPLPEEVQPEKVVIENKAYADWLGGVSARVEREVVAPHQKNRRPENKAQDGRELESCKKRRFPLL